jgi:NAD+ synthase
MKFDAGILKLDVAAEAARIEQWLRQVLGRDLRRRGLVIGLSGGVDSSVTAALAVRALGAERVFGLLMPERHSEEATLGLSQEVAEHLGVRYEVEDISVILESVGFYRRYDAAVAQVIPGYGEGWKSKLVGADVLGRDGFNYFTIVVEDPAGEQSRSRLPLEAYLEIVAATNFKQRTRKMLEYYHADRLNYAVAGTPNRLEYDQGFFVKNGDGAADVKPIAHLYKSQVYDLARFLGLPEAICNRHPTTDTYSLAQKQEEFYFPLPYGQMDLCLYGLNHGVAVEEVAAAAGLEVEQVNRVWADIRTKRSTTRYLHRAPVTVEALPLA